MFVVETASYTKSGGNHAGMAKNWKDFPCLCCPSPQKGICICCGMLQQKFYYGCVFAAGFCCFVCLSSCWAAGGISQSVHLGKNTGIKREVGSSGNHFFCWQESVKKIKLDLE